MARIRTIKPEFWEDEKIGNLPIPCRLFFIGCWNFADDFGVIKGNAALLKSQIFPYDETLRVSEVKKWIDALVDARMLIPIIDDDVLKSASSRESYYVIRTFRSHQVLDSRFERSCISKDKEYVKTLINNALHDYDVITTCSRRNHDVITTKEKEMEKEKENLPIGRAKKDAALAATLSRKEKFYQSLVPFAGKYPKDMIDAFFGYWSEMNKSCTKMRFEQQPTWETARRLATWASRDKNFNQHERTANNRQDYPTAEQRAADAASIIARLGAEDDAAGK